MRAAWVLLLAMWAGCTSTPDNQVVDAGNLRLVAGDRTDLPLPGLTPGWQTAFDRGDAVFERAFLEGDGLGPLYIRSACAACHAGDGRGPGLVEKMAQVEADGVTPVPGQPLLPMGHTVRNQRSAGASHGITAPDGVKVSVRVGPAVFGRGYMEAVADNAILEEEARQAARSDGISGRVNRVTYASQAGRDRGFGLHMPGDANLIGRFGLKARVVNLEDFAADALQGDMGITSPLRPTETPNPDGLLDDALPGLDVDLATVEDLADYTRLLRIPARAAPPPGGPELFEQTLCAACHVPSLRTRVDHVVPQLANVEAPIYSDLLLHDMGSLLADGLTDGSAGPSEWRTAPLMGLRHFRTYLHDGRARTVKDAVEHHHGPGSEANQSVELFRALTTQQQDLLVLFVEQL
jgi:CxxC motif-containing protein (DUF1111 family)